VAEIRDAIGRLPGGHRKQTLRAAAAEIFAMFAEQVLSFDVAAAEQYALVVSQRDGPGLPVDRFDGQIAALNGITLRALAAASGRGGASRGRSSRAFPTIWQPPTSRSPSPTDRDGASAPHSARPDGATPSGGQAAATSRLNSPRPSVSAAAACERGPGGAQGCQPIAAPGLTAWPVSATCSASAAGATPRQRWTPVSGARSHPMAWAGRLNTGRHLRAVIPPAGTAAVGPCRLTEQEW
jgi:hypothetical protein